MTTATAISAKGTWVIDASHSEIGFKVRHLLVTNVTGKFDKFEGSIDSPSDDFSDATIKFTAEVNSINTNSEQRDGHLKADDFFNAETYPHLSFTSTSFQKVSGNDFKLVGDITIRNITKSIELSVEYAGIANDPWGNTKSGFEINGRINRKDFDLKWDAITETGSAMLGEEVKLNLNIQLAKQA
jgi:polyisoprenoid-binding protein YceI